MHDNHENHCAICMRMSSKYLRYHIKLYSILQIDVRSYFPLILYVNERNWLY